MIFLLVKSIKTFVEGVVSELYQKKPDDAWGCPQVFIGALPPKDANRPDDFPFVVIRPSKGSDNGEGLSLVVVTLILGVHTAEAQPEAHEAGNNEVLNLLNRIRQALLKNRILANRFELKFPMEWQLGGEKENQPHPQYIASMKTQWLIPAIQPDMLPLQKEVTGYGAT